MLMVGLCTTPLMMADSSWVAQLCAIAVNFLTTVLQRPKDKM